eukprot:g13693.t1
MVSSEEDASAGELAGKILSGAADAVEFVAELGVELPFIGPIFNTINAIREKAEKVQSNREKLIDLHERCSRITARIIVEFKTKLSGLDVAPLERLVQDVDTFVTGYQQNSVGAEIWKHDEIEGKIAGLHEGIDRLERDLSLAGIAMIADEMRAQSEVKKANVPKGTLAHKPWYVERRRVMDRVLEALKRDGAPPLVGLVGGSGSGKTTAASEVVRSDEARKAFADGIVWLAVNEGANERLPPLMRQLARMVYEDIGGSVGIPPAKSEDGAAYIKQFVEKGHNGKGFKCLVVADNVWEEEVVSKLLETGMSVLVSTRHEELVTDKHGEAVGVDELSEEDAKLLLSKAAELPEGASLPDAAEDLVELCGRVAMDLAFVGRWSTVRGTEAREAWSKAVAKIKAEMDEIGRNPENKTAEVSHVTRREAILRAGFDDLAVGSGDRRVQQLYLSLAVMPDGHEFTVKDAAVLLVDRPPSPDDEAAVGKVVGILESWTILRPKKGIYQMLDAHSTFARERLMDHGYVRKPALERWVKHISSLESLGSFESYVLKGLWRAVECVGGYDWGWVKRRPYAKELAKVDNSDPSLMESLQRVADFQEVQEDWKGASNTWRRLLKVETMQLGADHPMVLGTYGKLAKCADRLHEAEEAAEWRKKEIQVLPSALTKMQELADADDFEQEEDPKGIFALASTRRKLGPHDRTAVRGMFALAYNRRKLGSDDRIAVEKLLRRSLEIFEANLGSDHADVAFTLRKLGGWLRDVGQLEEAEELLLRCWRIQEKNGVDDVVVAYTLNELGVCVREMGQERLEDAVDYLKRALGIKEAKLGRDHVQVAYTLHHLGISLRRAGGLEEAEKVLRRCLEIREVKLGPEDIQTASTLHKLGACIREARRLDEAEKLLRRSLQIKEAKLDPKNPDDLGLARTVHQLGMCIREARRFEEAEGYFRRCLGIVESKLGVDDGKVPNTVHAQLDKRQVEWLERARNLLKQYLEIEEANLDCKGADDILQKLPECLREARK